MKNITALLGLTNSFRERTKKTQKLREALGPKGSLHQSREEDKLKSTVQEAVMFIRTMYPSIAKGEMGQDVDAVEKAILKEKERKAKNRPELQVEDEMDDYMAVYDDRDSDLY